MTNIMIKDIEIYHPENKVSNDYFIEHFSKQDKDIKRFLEHMGRENRYIINDENENGLTMGVKSTKKLLQKLNMTGKDVDMIVFSTQAPETTYPTNAMFIHDAIEADQDTIIFDSNANCAGMTVAVEQASRYMMANDRVQNALIIGSDYHSLVSSPEDEITYSNFGDAAVSVLLEKTEENSGFIDAIYHTDSIYKDKIMYPANGLTSLVKSENEMDTYIKWLPFDGDVAMPPTYHMIEKLLSRNNLNTSDISAYCFSQFSLANILKLKDHFHLEEKQIIYIGDRFGYTGTSSPFLALYEGISTGEIKRGDLVVFWTIGSGYQLIAMLFRY